MRKGSILFVMLLCLTGLFSSCGGGGGGGTAKLSLSIDKTSLPTATVNVPYNQTVSMTASGGTPPYLYTCTVSSGAGISVSVTSAGATTGGVSCLISGTPLRAGAATINFAVSDNAQASLSAGSLSVTVLSAPTTAGSFSATGSMATARTGHTATLLSDGKVLISGGSVGTSFLSSAELYDPESGTFSLTGAMTTPRWGHTATLLPNGKVLVAGGLNVANSDIYLGSAELYDPRTGTFSATGTMTALRKGHTATLLPNGMVLITGGDRTSHWNTAELYDPYTGTFSPTGSLSTTRIYFTATLLPDGNVLIAGGVLVFYSTVYGSTESYDMNSKMFSFSGNMTTARTDHTATLLPDGRVLMTGGLTNPGEHSFSDFSVSSAELYDPNTGISSATGSMTTARQDHTATLLSNGRVLITGGLINSGGYTIYTPTGISAELYDPSTGIFSPTGSMTTARYGHRATLLSNGEVLITGGYDITSRAELYSP
jgi:hypothetical protein